VNAARRAEGEAAEKLLAGAVEDFQKSVDSGVKTSADLLAAAKAELGKVRAAMTKPPPVVADDPLAKFRPRWQQLILERKYKSARSAIDAEGKGLGDAQKKTLVDETERECRAWLGERMLVFRRSLAGIRRQDDLWALSDSEFDVSFALPDAQEIMVKDAAYEWAQAHRIQLKAVQSRKSNGAALIPAALAAVPLEERAENPWFRPLESVIFDSLRTAISGECDKARDAAAGERARARAEAERWHSEWKGFVARLDAKFRERHGVDARAQEIARLFEGFPADLKELARFAIDDVFANANPDAALAKHEQALMALEGRANVSRESRQALYGWIVTVGALRALYAGRSEEDAAKELAAYAEKLKAVGAPAETKRYGPRVGRVFDILLR
jgi:hypothetical protein